MRVLDLDIRQCPQLMYSPDSATLASSYYPLYATREVWVWDCTSGKAERELVFQPADYRPLLTHGELMTGKPVPFPKFTVSRKANYRSTRLGVCKALTAPVYGQLISYWPADYRQRLSRILAVRVLGATQLHPPIEWVAPPHTWSNRGIALSADGSRVAVWVGPRVRVWQVDTGAELTNFHTRRLTPAAVAFSADGRYLGVLYQDSVSLYDTASWTVAKTYSWKVGKLRTLAFSPDGATAAVGSDKGKIVVFDLE